MFIKRDTKTGIVIEHYAPVDGDFFLIFATHGADGFLAKAFTREGAETIFAAAVQERQQVVSYTEEQRAKIGQALIEMFYMRWDGEHKDRIQTTGGSKTAKGVFETFARIGADITSGKITKTLNL